MPKRSMNFNQHIRFGQVEIEYKSPKPILLSVFDVGAIQQCGKCLFEFIVCLACSPFDDSSNGPFRHLAALVFRRAELTFSGSADLLFRLWSVSLSFCGIVQQKVTEVRSHGYSCAIQSPSYKCCADSKRSSNGRTILTRLITTNDLIHVYMLYFGIETTTLSAVFFIKSDNAFKSLAAIRTRGCYAFSTCIPLTVGRAILLTARDSPSHLKSIITMRATANDRRFSMS
jgi:hypothetical protein